jgi:hypothetical protein
MNLKVKANIGKNRLYFTISGKAVKEELDKLYTDVRFSVADLKPGFDVISDLSECSLGHLSGVPTFRKIMNFLISKEVGSVVRVIKGDSIIFKQIMNISARICGYEPIYVSSLEEAEEKLDQSIKRNGIRFRITDYLPVTYISNETNGKGNIYNLSTSGCAIEVATLPVSIDDDISLKFEFKAKDKQAGEFIIKAKVVRADEKTFAVTFNDLNGNTKDLLWKCLIDEAQREL